MKVRIVPFYSCGDHYRVCGAEPVPQHKHDYSLVNSSWTLGVDLDKGNWSARGIFEKECLIKVSPELKQKEAYKPVLAGERVGTCYYQYSITNDMFKTPKVELIDLGVYTDDKQEQFEVLGVLCLDGAILQFINHNLSDVVYKFDTAKGINADKVFVDFVEQAFNKYLEGKEKNESEQPDA